MKKPTCTSTIPITLIVDNIEEQIGFLPGPFNWTHLANFIFFFFFFINNFPLQSDDYVLAVGLVESPPELVQTVRFLLEQGVAAQQLVDLAPELFAHFGRIDSDAVAAVLGAGQTDGELAGAGKSPEIQVDHRLVGGTEKRLHFRVSRDDGVGVVPRQERPGHRFETGDALVQQKPQRLPPVRRLVGHGSQFGRNDDFGHHRILLTGQEGVQDLVRQLHEDVFISQPMGALPQLRGQPSVRFDDRTEIFCDE